MTAAGPVRVCMVLHGPFPPDPRVAREARRALQAGYEVDLVAMRQPGQAAEELIEGIQVIRLPVAHCWGAGLGAVAHEYLGFTARAIVRVASLHLRRRYRVVQVHNPPDFLILAALVPRLTGARTILDVHDLGSDMFSMRFGERRGARLTGLALRGVERVATAMADAVLTVHAPYREELVKRGVRRERVTVVMNSLDEALIPEPASPEDGFRVVYHGTITPPYGLQLLVEGFAIVVEDVPEARLEIYGDGDSLPEVRRAVERLGLEGCVQLSGAFLGQGKVLERIRTASAGVVPTLASRYTTFSLSTKLLEYVALRLPVVSSDLPTIRAHFSRDELLFFRAGDARSLGRALVSVAQDPAGARERAEAALRRYGAYRWSTNGDRYVDVLDRLSERSAAAHGL